MPHVREISPERLGRIVDEAASEVYLFSSDDFKFVFVNRGARDNLGYTMAELRQLTPWDIKPEISREQFLELVAPLLSGALPRLDFETLHARKDGTHYTVAVRLQLIESEGSALFFAAIQDVSALKQTRQALQEASARLEAILGNTTMAVFMMDARQHCVFMNAAAEQLTGYTLEETRGRTLHEVIHHTYPDGRPFPLHECAIDRAFPENNQTRGEEVFVHKDGSFYPVGFTASPMKDANGRTYGTIIEARNIARDLEAREAMESFNQTLKARVADAIAERQKLEGQLIQAQKMESLGQLTGGIAHDFNNLLQVISGNLQLLQKEIDAADPRQRRVGNALVGVGRGAQLAAQLLAFGRQQALDPKPVNFGSLVRGMDDMLRRTLGEAIEIETVISGGLWNCMADPAQVENVLLNLAINARDAMSGSGKLTIEAGNALLDEAYASVHPEVTAGQYVMLAVTDTGGGIPPEILDKVFEPFFTTKKSGEGTGLGLSMVYGFVKQSGGHIKIYSEPGEGTTFRIYLPRTRRAEDRPTPEAAASLNNGGTETILAVEDDEAVRSTTVELLRDLGYVVLEASSADNALAVINSGIHIDLLFTDVVMPGKLRSPELAEIARRRIPNIRVLFTSGYTQNAIVHAGRLDEGVELIAKPFTRESLSAKIRRILSQPALSPEPAVPGPDAGATPDKSPDQPTGLRILVVEDEVLIRMTLTETLDSMGHQTLEAGTLRQALQHVEAGGFDVVITDLGLPDGSGAELIGELRARHPGVVIVVATGHAGSLEPAGMATHDLRYLRKPYDEQSLAAVLSDLPRG